MINKISAFIQRKLSKKFNTKLCLERLSFNYGRICFHCVYIKKKQIAFHSKLVSLSFFKKNKLLTISAELVEIKASESENIQSTGPTQPFKRAKSIFPFKIPNWISIEVQQIVILTGKEKSILDSFFFHNSKFSFEIECLLNYTLLIKVTGDINANALQLYFASRSYEDGIALNIGHGVCDLSFKVNKSLEFKFQTHEIIINHKKICDDRMKIDSLQGLIKFDLSNTIIELSDESFFKLGESTFYPHFMYDSTDPDFISLGLLMCFKPEDILKLIPSLGCKDLRNFKSSGGIEIRVLFGFLRSNPLMHKFKLDYEIERFKIIDPGVDLYYLRNEFEFYPHFEKTSIDRNTIKVKTNFFKQNKLLSKTIQTTEDPDFYKHYGVDINSIGKAFAMNIANKGFLLGASTITMQIAKNLFLSNSKTLTRKVEEIIIALLIENYFIISKERLLDIYGQIIKFSTDSYGIDSAAELYFNKNITDINLMESIVLSYIIPRPNYFLAAVKQQSLQLDENLSFHIKHYYPLLRGKRSNEPISNQIVFSKEIGSLFLKNLDLAI